MKNEPTIIQIDNLEKRLSLQYTEDENNIFVVAQEMGKLTVSAHYDKKTQRLEKMEGSLAHEIDKLELSPQEKVQRLQEYTRAVVNEYNSQKMHNIDELNLNHAPRRNRP